MSRPGTGSRGDADGAARWVLEVIYLVDGTTTIDKREGALFSRQMFPDGRANIVQFDAEGAIVGTWQYRRAERVTCTKTATK